jgi:hypothetical protein
MVIENQIPLFFEWLPGALVSWLIVVGLLALAAMALAFIVAAVQRGPMPAADAIYNRVAGGVTDVVRMSPRRVLALAGLAFQEAIKRRVIVAFLVFLVVLAFAVWFLDPSTPNPARLYISFVMTAAAYLVLLLSLFLSVFSLPADITRRTIYTIVTKPVRQSEIVLGRILGFAAIGTLLLALMGVVSYIFVTRQLDHAHDVEEASLVDVTPADNEKNPIVKRGRTTNVQGHRHVVYLRQDGTGETDAAQDGHWHAVTTDTSGGKTRYLLSDPRGMLTARVPVYGKLQYRNNQGTPSTTADNVGNEWTYRQFIEGGTPAAAIWTFNGIRPEDFENGLPFQMTLAVFRTHKGNIERPVLGSIQLQNPVTGLESRERNFTSKEFAIHEELVPRKLLDKENNSIDVFEDLVADGQLQVVIRCIDAGQYFGAAQPDLYLLAREARFRPNFIKGFAGIWLQMVLITGFGVMFSTFLNGPVAMMATLATLVAGMRIDKIVALVTGEQEGGLMFESLYRIVTHAPMTTELDPGIGTSVIKGLDAVVGVALRVISSVMPNLPGFSDVNFVADGFDIPWNNIAVHTTTALGYLIPLFIAGYFFLKTREVAK